MKSLVDDVRSLPHAGLLETATFVLPQLTGNKDAREIESEFATLCESAGLSFAELQNILNRIRGDRQSQRFLLQSILLDVAEGSAEEQAQLRTAVSGVGKNQVVVELLFAISAASLVTLYWCASPPPERETRKTVRTIDLVNGTMTEQTEETIERVPPPVKDLFGWISKISGMSMTKS